MRKIQCGCTGKKTSRHRSQTSPFIVDVPFENPCCNNTNREETIIEDGLVKNIIVLVLLAVCFRLDWIDLIDTKGFGGGGAFL